MCWKLAISIDFGRKYECSAFMKNHIMRKKLELESNPLEIIALEYGPDWAHNFAILGLG